MENETGLYNFKPDGIVVYDSKKKGKKVVQINGYPLATPMAAVFDGKKVTLGDFKAEAESLGEGLKIIGEKIHSAFITFFARTNLADTVMSEREAMGDFFEFIDYKKLLEQHPVEEHIHGRVLSADEKLVTLEIYYGEYRFRQAALPMAFGKMGADDIFEATVVRFDAGTFEDPRMIWKKVRKLGEPGETDEAGPSMPATHKGRGLWRRLSPFDATPRAP